MANSIPKSVAPTSKTFTRCLNGCVAVLVILATLFVVQHTKLSDIILRNTTITTELEPNVFILATRPSPTPTPTATP